MRRYESTQAGPGLADGRASWFVPKALWVTLLWTAEEFPFPFDQVTGTP
jgi:hypothetical protein